MQKRRKKQKKDDKLLILLILFLLIFSYFEVTGDYRLGGILRDLLFNPTKVIEPSNLLNSFNDDLLKENNELKEILKIDYSLKDFEIKYATVVERNNSFWLNELTINKGKSDGVDENYVVLGENGLIGRVISSSLTTSKIKLITSDNNKVSVKINNSNKILERKDNNLIIRGINTKDKIKEGDKVLTSGLSDKYPEGIIIGKIENIEKEDSGVGYFAYVSLEQDIDDLHFVILLKRKDK